jgi:hypothetical protein
MSLIDVRIFKVTTRIGGIDGLEVVGDPQLTDEQVWDISLAQVIAVNALAVPAERSLSYRVLRHELRLLLSFLSDHARDSHCGNGAASSGT